MTVNCENPRNKVSGMENEAFQENTFETRCQIKRTETNNAFPREREKKKITTNNEVDKKYKEINNGQL